MKTRGRTSIHALSIVPINAVQRAAAPNRLTDEEKILWKQIIDRLPEDWFPAETLPLLEEYCIHTCIHRMLVERVRDDPSTRNIRLMTYQAEITIKIATKLRITQQSYFDRRRSRRARATGTHGKPWQKEED